MKITNREKNLLGVLGILIIVTLGYRFIFAPVLEKSKALQIDLSTYIDKEARAKNLLLQATSLEENLQEQQALKEVRMTPFFDVLDPEYLERWIDTVKTGFDIKITNLQIGETIIGEVPTYSIGNGSLEYPIKDYYMAITEDDEKTNEEVNKEVNEEASSNETNNEALLQIPVSLNLKGNKMLILSFLDKLIHNDKYVTVENLNIEGEAAELQLIFYAVHRDKDQTLDYSFDNPVGHQNIME